MTHHQFGGTVLAAILLVALTGCSEPAPAAPVPSASLPSASPTEPVDDPEVIAAPTADADSQASALETAERAALAFARPQLSPRAWYDGMLPYLSQRGAEAYAGTDPSMIRVTAITGAGAVLEGSTDVLLIVALPTDAGTYNITLTRSGVDDAWLVERIRPAAA